MPWRSSVRSMRARAALRRKVFPQAPNLTLASYRRIGCTATRYTAGGPATPVPVKIDTMMRLRLIVHTSKATIPRTWTLRSKSDDVGPAAFAARRLALAGPPPGQDLALLLVSFWLFFLAIDLQE
jgi:hypothetical protein